MACLWQSLLPAGVCGDKNRFSISNKWLHAQRSCFIWILILNIDCRASGVGTLWSIMTNVKCAIARCGDIRVSSGLLCTHLCYWFICTKLFVLLYFWARFRSLFSTLLTLSLTRLGVGSLHTLVCWMSHVLHTYMRHSVENFNELVFCTYLMSCSKWNENAHSTTW